MSLVGCTAHTSTATLNPLSVTYCIPPDSNQPLFIPIVFNNSLPYEVTYSVRSFDTGHAKVESVPASSLTKPASRTPRRAIADSETDDDIEPGAVTIRTANLDLAMLSSVRPADSLAWIPETLEASEHLLYLSVSKPAVLTLRHVTDRRGDRFHVTPHKEAIVVECPSSSSDVDAKGSGAIRSPAQIRCVGEEETIAFEARGVGALKVAWRKRSKDTTSSGVIEGIEDEHELVDQLTLTRPGLVAKTHTIPLRIVHDAPGIHTVTFTSVTDSMFNSYSPSGPGAEQSFNVLARSSASFDAGPLQLLAGGSVTLPIKLDGSGPLSAPLDITYTFSPVSGVTQIKTLSMTKRTETLTVTEPGTLSLMNISGQCSGTIREPSSCTVRLIPQPTVELNTQTMHEWSVFCQALG